MTKIQLVVLIAALGVGGYWLTRDWFRPGLEPVLIEDSTGVDSEVMRLVDRQVEAILRAPRDAQAHGSLGMIYEAANMWNEGQLSYANAAQLAPSDARWRYHRAVCLLETGSLNEAHALLEQAASELSNEAAPHHRLGLERLRAGDLAGAEASLQLAHELAPDRPQPMVGLAEVAIEHDQYATAIERLEGVLQGSPDYKQAHYLLGVAYRGQGRMRSAERELILGTDAQHRFMSDSLSTEINRYRVNQTVVVDRAVGLIERKKFAQAIPLLEGVRIRRPDDLYVLNMLGSAYVGLNEFDKARSVLRTVIERDPAPYAALINLSDCCLRERKLAEALHHAERAVSMAPEVAATHFARARALLLMQANEEAYTALKETVRVDSQFSQAHVALGEVCCLLNRTDEGIEHFRVGVRLDPDQLRATATLASLLMTAGRHEEARPYVEEAERIAPDEPRVKMLRERLEQRR